MSDLHNSPAFRKRYTGIFLQVVLTIFLIISIKWYFNATKEALTNLTYFANDRYSLTSLLIFSPTLFLMLEILLNGFNKLVLYSMKKLTKIKPKDRLALHRFMADILRLLFVSFALYYTSDVLYAQGSKLASDLRFIVLGFVWAGYYGFVLTRIITNIIQSFEDANASLYE
ncbi:hypothetical protein O3W44_20990 [Pantoea sp. LMR881]|uniref:hypothetical protein n=1 Tax=Pantoea sp. LMR881 TaxID=3014336 RepID=UPI0022AF3C6D|nr:hypothetical protein [Pantoea sp. LMR881]MCZ4061032.1 hypothetical protein [Pantoea sp. LMR881]